MMDLQQIKPGREEDFRDSVLESARNQAATIVKAAENAREKALRAARAQCEKADYGPMKAQQQRATLRKSAKTAMEARGEVLQYRTQLVNEMFDEVREKLQDFAKSKEYLPFLQARLKKYEEKIGAKDKLVVYVGETDLAHEAALKETMPQAEVEPDGSIEFGGFKLVVGRTMFDETLDDALRQQQQAFYANSRLEVNVETL